MCTLLAAGLWLIATGGVAADSYLEAYASSHEPSSHPPPGVVYAERFPQAIYGQPHPSVYGEPHAAPEQPLAHLGMKLATVFAILLKVLIFKMIVKFLAVICLLFILPKLTAGEAHKGSDKHDKDKDKDKGRDLMELTVRVSEALKTEGRVCNDPACQLLRAARRIDSIYTLPRLYSIFSKQQTDISVKETSRGKETAESTAHSKH